MNDTDKLNLIREHSLEYYEHPRAHKFTKHGFLEYSIFISAKNEISLYISELFVSKKYRSGTAFNELIDVVRDLIDFFDIEVTFARTELNNPYFDNMKRMYDKEGFITVYVDEEAEYYRRDTP
jgi:hypothetical protein